MLRVSLKNLRWARTLEPHGALFTDFNTVIFLNKHAKILVRSTNWIGDAIMTTPAIGILKRRFPDAAIHVLARPWVAPVFSANPDVDTVIEYTVAKGLNGVKHRIELARALGTTGYDAAVVFPNSMDSALVIWMARIPNRLGYDKDCRGLFLNLPVPTPADKAERHEVYYYLRLIDYLVQGDEVRADRDAEGPFIPRLRLVVPAQGRQGAERLLKDAGADQEGPLVVFNPGAAYGPAKCWPVESFMALGQALVSRLQGCRIIVLGTERERALAETISNAIGVRGYNLAGRTSLEEAMGIIESSDLLVTNDSGLMHVGAALSRPTVAIFGSTNPVTTGPWSENSVVVRHELPCSPCLKRECPAGFECMRDITPEEVLDACLHQLDAG